MNTFETRKRLDNIRFLIENATLTSAQVGELLGEFGRLSLLLSIEDGVVLN